MKIIFVLLLSALLAVAHAQSCKLSLSGKLVLNTTGSVLDDANIYLMELAKGVKSNEKGEFVFTQLCEGEYRLKISHLTCKDTIIQLNLVQDTKLEIKISAYIQELLEVDIEEKQHETHTQAHSQLSAREMNRVVGLSLGESLKQLSGVNALATGPGISKPMIHGMQGYRVLILNNGIRHEGQQWGNEHAPEIDPFIASKISVIKGAGAIRYGSDALAGVVLVEPESLPDTLGTYLELNEVAFSNGRQGVSSALMQGKIKRIAGISWRLQGTLKKAGDAQTPEYILKNTGLTEKNFSSALALHRRKWGAELFYSQFHTQIGIFSGSHIGNLSDLQWAFQQHKPKDSLALFSYGIDRPYQLVSHELIKPSWHAHLTPRSRLYINLAWQHNQRKEFDKHLFYAQQLNDSLKNKPELDYRVTTRLADVLWQHDNISSFRGQAGFSYMDQQNVYLGRYFIPNYILHTWGMFVMERFVQAHFEIEAGCRYDERLLKAYYYDKGVLQKPELHFNNMSWSTGFIWKPKPLFRIMLHVGSSWRAPGVNELYSNGLHHGAAAIERGDPLLKPEKAIQYSITCLYSGAFWKMEVNAYHNTIKEFIFQNPGPFPELTIKGAFPVFYYRQANVSISGTDVKWNVDLGKFIELENKSTLIMGYNHSQKNHLIYMPANRTENTITLKLKDKRLVKDNRISLSALYVSKQWRVPDGLDFAPPPAAYLLFNTEIASKLVIGKQELLCGLSINNMMNTRYRDYLDRFRYYSDAIGRNIQLRIKVPIYIKAKQTQTEK